MPGTTGNVMGKETIQVKTQTFSTRNTWVVPVRLRAKVKVPITAYMGVSFPFQLDPDDNAITEENYVWGLSWQCSG